jgi:hypothetical protein
VNHHGKKVYFSDGSAAQYKNRKKKLINITCHNEDFGVPTEW